MFHKMHHKAAVLLAPTLANSSCNHPRNVHIPMFSVLTTGDVIQALLILLLTIGVLGANMLLILVINSRRYSKYIHSQPRYLLTSLASNDFAMGLFVTPFAIVPSLRHCWPYGELICQLQALLKGAISQQSAVILICMAMDRYVCMLHPAKYYKHSSKKGCVAIISITWIISVTLFSILVLPRGGFYFNQMGIVACEPFYSQASTRILVACGFYFPTTMVLMYCYGSAFHVNKLKLEQSERNFSSNVANLERYEECCNIKKFVSQERKLTTMVSRTMAAMSLGFIVLVTPWTIQEVVAACTGSRAPPAMDFFTTWLALSNSFWNPFLYWLLNNHFRKVSQEILFNKIICKKSKEQKHQDNFKNFHNQTHCCSHIDGILNHTQGCDFERLSEKYWGDILERTLSSGSLHALQKAYSLAHMGSCNGLEEMKVFDTTITNS